MTTGEPEITTRTEDGLEPPVLVWRFPEPRTTISTGPLGGGIGPRSWTINASVPLSYDRPDPACHLEEIARGLGLHGAGVGLLTGVDVRDVVRGTDDGVTVWATVGVGSPAWAAAGDGSLRALRRHRVGTINLVASVPVTFTDSALVNAVATMTEAKSQALWDARIAATGTATDSVTIHTTPGGGLHAYGGPRSEWGARVARATRDAVCHGLDVWLRGGTSWSAAQGIPDPPLPPHATEEFR